MFPPSKSKPAGPGGKPSGPPDPFAPPAGPGGPPPGPPGSDPFAVAGPPPPGGPPLGMAPGMPRPGQGMDPMIAMNHGLAGPDPAMTAGAPPDQGPPMGPDGFPVGGSLPPMGEDGMGDMGGSGLLQALAGVGGQGDPYAVGPVDPLRAFEGIGQGDPNMGINQILQMLALGQMGVGGPGSSGADPGGGQIGSSLGAY